MNAPQGSRAEGVRAPATPAYAQARTRRAMAWLLALAALVPVLAPAATRAWLDRNGIVQGEPVTLNIETDQPGVAPDYTPLQADFQLGPPFRSRQSIGRHLFGVVLTPRRSGVVPVPSLRIGAERTPQLLLRVAAAPAAAPAARGEVFIDSQVDDPAPYVQQSVGITVQLFYATPLLSGELTQLAPDGASLQRVGEDVQSQREIGGRRYQVVERRYLLVPERSGALQVPPPHFRGQGAGGFFDDFFGADRNLSAVGTAQPLQVRAQPDGAPQPWLPLHGLRLRYLAAPAQARVGEAVELAVEAVALGATAAQFPEIPPPRVDGAQVFAERAETTERFIDGRPQLTVVRRFSVVPLQAGTLPVPGLAMDWWDTAAAQAEQARLPPLQLQVAAAADGQATTPPPSSPGASLPASSVATGDAVPGTAATSAGYWPWLALLFVLLWLATLAWALRRGAVRAAPTPPAGAAAPAPHGQRSTLADLRRALDAGSFDEAVMHLRFMASPPAADLDEVVARLADPEQRQALEAMRRALWAGAGAPADARARLRAAFRQGPAWTTSPAPADAVLPPLYPAPRRDR